MADEIMRVFIIDNNVAWLDAIGTLLSQQPDMHVIGKDAFNHDAINHLNTSRPDVLLIGLDASAGELRNIVAQLRRDLSDMAIIIHGQLGQPVDDGVIAAGASGYLPKGSSPKTILQTIRDARYHLDARPSTKAT